jgi:hypothetical protein
VGVSNGSGTKNQATDVSTRLASLGYDASITRDASRVQARTVVRYAPGLQAQADLLARQLAAGAQLQADTSLSGAAVPVVLVTGTDFTSVLDQPTPSTSSTSTSTLSTSSTAAKGSSTSSTSTTVAREVAQAVGYEVGEPPEGVSCD